MSNIIHSANFNFPQIAREYGLKLRELESGVLDWRLIGSYDVGKLIHDSDFERLEIVIPHLTDAPLGTILNNSVLDSGISKYFCLAQLSLQYLTFCCNFLEKTVVSLRKNVYNIEKDKQKLLKAYKKQKQELFQVHKKIFKSELNENKTYSCEQCTKNFVNSDLLSDHYERKHSSSHRTVDGDKNLVNNIMLELEIKQLKQKLNDAQKEKENKSQASIGIQSNLEEEKDKDESLHSHRQLIIDSQHQLVDLLKAQLNAMDDWKTTEMQRHQEETQEFKVAYKKAISLMSQKSCIVLNRTKLDQFSIPAEQVSFGFSGKEDLVKEWQKKYQDLEASYKESHDKMNSILMDLDKKNKDQLLHIESLKKKPDMRDFSIQANLSIPSVNQNLSSKNYVDKNRMTSKMVSFRITDEIFTPRSEDDEESISELRMPDDKVFKAVDNSEDIKKYHRTLVTNRINSFMQSVGILSQSRVDEKDFDKISKTISQKRYNRSRIYNDFTATRNVLVKRINNLAKSAI
ncbi:hypothetical protein DMENIID0001_110070 [Sergentomyia squamirostris]